MVPHDHRMQERPRRLAPFPMQTQEKTISVLEPAVALELEVSQEYQGSPVPVALIRQERLNREKPGPILRMATQTCLGNQRLAEEMAPEWVAKPEKVRERKAALEIRSESGMQQAPAADPIQNSDSELDLEQEQEQESH